MKIWIDIKNTHEPLLFKCLTRELPYEFYISIRENAEVRGLMERYGMTYRVIGSYEEKGKVRRAFSLLSRTLFLASRVPRFDYLLSHGSLPAIMACKLRFKKSITITDNDLNETLIKMVFRYSDYLIIPKFVDFRRFRIPDTKVRMFDGFKEDLYIADFNPEQCNREIPFDRYVVIRPEAHKAHYVSSTEKSIVPELIEKFLHERYNVVLLPRYSEEKAMYRKKYGDNKALYIPEKPINGLCAAWYAEAVLTGSGTLGREAACIGTTAVSFFPGKELLSVDKELINRGLYYHSRNPEEIIKYVLSAPQKRRSTERSKVVKTEVIRILMEIIGEKK